MKTYLVEQNYGTPQPDRWNQREIEAASADDACLKFAKHRQYESDLDIAIDVEETGTNKKYCYVINSLYNNGCFVKNIIRSKI